MGIQVLIPTPLQKFTNDQASVELDATDVNSLIAALDGQFHRTHPVRVPAGVAPGSCSGPLAIRK